MFIFLNMQIAVVSLGYVVSRNRSILKNEVKRVLGGVSFCDVTWITVQESASKGWVKQWEPLWRIVDGKSSTGNANIPKIFQKH